MCRSPKGLQIDTENCPQGFLLSGAHFQTCHGLELLTSHSTGFERSRVSFTDCSSCRNWGVSSYQWQCGYIELLRWTGKGQRAQEGFEPPFSCRQDVKSLMSGKGPKVSHPSLGSGKNDSISFCSSRYISPSPFSECVSVDTSLLVLQSQPL